MVDSTKFVRDVLQYNTENTYKLKDFAGLKNLLTYLRTATNQWT